ncbi:hypothetical protein JXQ70_08385 [bacterium]|nr:hypothetical protein [bacterium]
MIVRIVALLPKDRSRVFYLGPDHNLNADKITFTGPIVKTFVHPKSTSRCDDPFFDLFISELVLVEIAGGDSDAAARRHALVQEIPVLELTAETATTYSENEGALNSG